MTLHYEIRGVDERGPELSVRIMIYEEAEIANADDPDGEPMKNRTDLLSTRARVSNDATDDDIRVACREEVAAFRKKQAAQASSDQKFSRLIGAKEEVLDD